MCSERKCHLKTGSTPKNEQSLTKVSSCLTKEEVIVEYRNHTLDPQDYARTDMHFI
jgi:hypothetical protein